MIGARVGLWIVFALFMALSVEVLWQFGTAGFLATVFANGATTLAFIDLAIALSLMILVMAKDAARSGRRVWPFVVLTLAFGSAGPLLYLALGPEALGPLQSPKGLDAPADGPGTGTYRTAAGR